MRWLRRLARFAADDFRPYARIDGNSPRGQAFPGFLSIGGIPCPTVNAENRGELVCLSARVAVKHSSGDSAPLQQRSRPSPRVAGSQVRGHVRPSAHRQRDEGRARPTRLSRPEDTSGIRSSTARQDTAGRGAAQLAQFNAAAEQQLLRVPDVCSRQQWDTRARPPQPSTTPGVPRSLRPQSIGS
jgi:hypothetical protein